MFKIPETLHENNCRCEACDKHVYHQLETMINEGDLVVVYDKVIERGLPPYWAVAQIINCWNAAEDELVLSDASGVCHTLTIVPPGRIEIVLREAQQLPAAHNCR